MSDVQILSSQHTKYARKIASGNFVKALGRLYISNSKVELSLEYKLF